MSKIAKEVSSRVDKFERNLIGVNGDSFLPQEGAQYDLIQTRGTSLRKLYVETRNRRIEALRTPGLSDEVIQWAEKNYRKEAIGTYALEMRPYKNHLLSWDPPTDFDSSLLVLE